MVTPKDNMLARKISSYGIPDESYVPRNGQINL